MATGGKLGSSQIDASDALHDFSCAPCSDDGKNTEALFQCTDCQIYYCQQCVTGHNKYTKNHSVVDKNSKIFGQNRIQARSVSSSELPTDLCEEHQGEVIKMFCGTHELVCCTVCIAVKHRSCKGVEYIPNIAKRNLKQLRREKEKTKSSLEKVKDDLQNVKFKMLNELKELNKQRDSILDDIQKFKKRLIERVEKMEKKSIEKVQGNYKEIADGITVGSKKIDDMLEDVNKLLDKLKQSKIINVAQKFVDIKYGDMQVAGGNDFIKQSTAKKVKRLEFVVNKNIETRLLEAESFATPRATMILTPIKGKT